MALTLGTNAYITVAAANSYFLDNLSYTQWNPIDSTIKSRGIITAATQISALLNDDNKLPMLAANIDPVIAQANAELALAFILKPSLVTAANTGSNVKKVSATSGTDVEFFRADKGQRFPANVMNLLNTSGLLDGAGSAKFAGVEAYGLSPPTNVFNPDTFGKPKGFA